VESCGLSGVVSQRRCGGNGLGHKKGENPGLGQKLGFRGVLGPQTGVPRGVRDRVLEAKTGKTPKELCSKPFKKRWVFRQFGPSEGPEMGGGTPSKGVRGPETGFPRPSWGVWGSPDLLINILCGPYFV